MSTSSADKTRWGILGTYVWPNFYIAPSWDAEITWMSGWLEDRVAWMDGQLLGLPSSPQFSSEGGFIEPGFQLEITSADEGVIYYTTDGSDPRDLPSKTVNCKLRHGDVFSMRTQGGGGYGPSEERDKKTIARDLREEKISPESAHDHYGYSESDQ